MVIEDQVSKKDHPESAPDSQSQGYLPSLSGKQILPSSTPMVGERRQATVLITDVVRSTQILEKIGGETWVEMMNQVLQIMGDAVYRFGGVVDQYRGDGMLAFFGARSSHEDDPERATMAALVIQDRMKNVQVKLSKRFDIDLKVRIGVNTGEVITANIGNRDTHSEETAMGGAITLAARLEAAASPGSILVSESTYKLVSTRFNWEPQGEIEVQGISIPVAVYLPISPLSEAEQQHRLQAYGLSIPLIGRDDEINAIKSALDDLRSHIGGIFLISGDAGMGKSRLIFETRQQVIREEALGTEDEPSLNWLQGRCRSYGQSLPESMWVDMLQRWLGNGRWIPQSEALTRLLDKSKIYWGDQYEEYYPFIAAFLSFPIEKKYQEVIDRVDAEGLRNRFFIAVYQLLERMAQEAPVVVVFSEVHWADEASLELLKFCLPLFNKESIIFMVIFRPERTAPVWGFQHFVETDYYHRLKTLNLQPLKNDKSRELLHEMIGLNTLSERTTNQVIEKADGNPFYLTELVRSLVEKQILVRNGDSGEWQAIREDIPLDLPESLNILLMARIDNLTPSQRRTLQLASVIGPLFWYEILQTLNPGSPDLKLALADLQRAQLITERGLLPDLGREYVFTSALIREAAYDSLLSSQKNEHHSQVAKFLESVVLKDVLINYHGIIAYHYGQAGICQKELLHTMLAAESSQKIYANIEAILDYQHALALMDRSEEWDCVPPDKLLDEWRLEVLQGLGKIQFGVGEIAEAEKNLRAAVNLGREIGLNPSELTRLFYWLGEVLFWQNQYEEPVHLGEEGLFLLGDNNRSTEAALMNQLVAVGCSQLGDHEKFIKFTQRTAGFIQNLPYTEELRPAYDHIIGMYAYTLKNVPEAESWLSVFKRIADENEDLRALGEVYNHTAMLLNRQGDLKSAIHFYSKAIDHFDRIGDDKHTCRSLRGLGVCHFRLGNLDEAEVNILLSLEKAKVIQNPIDLSLGYWFKAQIQLCQGLREESTTTLNEAQKLASEIPIVRGGWIFLGLGQVHFSHANADEISDHNKHTLDDITELVFRNPYMTARILSRLERSYRDPIEYREYVDRFRQMHSNLNLAPFSQWYLKPVEGNFILGQPIFHGDFNTAIPECLAWKDPFGDCQFVVSDGLTIQSANERNFHNINSSAPRLIHKTPIMGDFTVQTKIAPGSEDVPTIGGLLSWQNKKNWFCLEFGSFGSDEVVFRGFKRNNDLIFGRGLLLSKTGYLRLVKHRDQISAFCSSDNLNWFFVGNTNLESDEPVYPGIHAIGHINRMIYPGAFPQGTAIRFDDFTLWDT
jgi:class 3 adenylate cyclase/tetratricopeptide (TPR) repeat protein